MPVSARELFLIVRARDEASNTLRRVGQNIDRLQVKNLPQLQARARDLQGALTVNANRQAAAEAKLAETAQAYNAALTEQEAIQARLTTQQELYLRLTQQGLAVQAAGARELGQLQTLQGRRTGILAATGGVETPLSQQLLRQIEQQAAAVEQLRVRAEQLGQGEQRLSAAMEKSTVALEAQQAKAQALVGTYNELAAASGALQKEQSALAGELEATQAAERNIRFQNFDKTAHAVGNLGRTFQYMGAVAVGALGFAANSAAHLQSSVALAATQVRNSVKGVQAETNTDFNFILQQMRKFPAAASDMSASLYDIFSTLNVNGKQGRDVLVQVNKAAVAGQISVQQATQGVLSVLNNFKLSWRDTGSVLNRTFAAVRFGRATLDQFQTALQTMAPAAKAAQQSFNTLAGTFAFLSRSLGPAKAAVGFARLQEVLNSPQMQKGLAGFGVHLQDANGHIKPFAQQIDILIKRFPYLEQGGSKALNFFKNIGGLQGTIQARRAFETIVTNVQGFRNLLHKTITDNNEFNKSYTALAKTAGVQWGIFLNTLKSVFITIGAAVLPTFVKLVHPLQEVADWFNKLDKSTQATIGRWLALAAIGATVGGTILAIGSAIGLTINGLAALTGAAGPLAGFVELVPMLAGIALVGYEIYKNWSTLEPLFTGIYGALKSVAETLKSFFDAIPGPVKELAVNIAAAYAATRLLVTAFAAIRGLTIVETLTQIATQLVAVQFGAVEAEAGMTALFAAMGPIGWIAIAAGIAITAYQLLGLGKNSNTTADDVNKLHDAIQSSAQAAQDYASTHQGVQTTNQAIHDTEKQMKGLNVQSLKYRQLLGTLHGLEQQRTTDLQNEAKATADMKSSIGTQLSALTTLQQHGIFKTDFSKIGSVADNIKSFMADPFSSKSRNNLAALSARSQLSAATSNFQILVAQGINPASKAMQGFRKEIVLANLELSKSDPVTAFKNLSQITPIVTQFTKMLGTPPNARQQAYLNSIPASIKGGMELYTRLTGQIATRPIANLLFKNRDVDKAVARFIATTKDKFGSAKFEADLNIVVKNAEQAKQKAEAAAKKIADAIARQQRRIAQLQQVSPHTGRDTGAGVGQALLNAQKELQKLQNKKINIDANIKPKDPWKPFKTAPNLHSATASIIAQMGQAGTSAGQGFKAAFDAEAQKLAASGQLTIDVVKKSIGAHSPATKFMPVGQSAMQGFIKGLIKEAEGSVTKSSVQSAMKTITDTMASTWDSALQTMQSNFGALFSGTSSTLFHGTSLQDKINWGELLNIGDLTADLKVQRQQFHIFEHDLVELRRRHAPLALIQQLEQLGPSANAELQALTSGSRKQLREYFRLFTSSQRDITRATHQSFDVQRKVWMEHGRAVAVGLLLGLKNEEPQLERYFKHLAAMMIETLRKHNRSHSPSMLYFDEGVNMMKGLQMGMDSVALKMGNPKVYGKHHGGNVYNINVTANHDESFSTTMKRLEFRLRHA